MNIGKTYGNDIIISHIWLQCLQKSNGQRQPAFNAALILITDMGIENGYEFLQEIASGLRITQ